MKNTNSFLLPALAVLASLVLSACGGGGGTDTGGGSGGGGGTTTYTATCYDNTTRTSTVSLADAQALCPVVAIVTSVPAATYAANSQEKAAFDYLNNARSTCGFGLLAQNAQLDAAAANHAAYGRLNNVISHFETQGLPGFTGYSSIERATYTGYSGITSEVAIGGPFVNSMLGTLGVDSVRTLLSAPYHFRSMMEGWRDISVGLNTSGGGYFLVMDPGYQSNDFKQQPANTEVLTYPCQSTIDTATALTAESPWPWPGHGAMGQSILVQVAEGNTLVLNSYTITRTAGPGIDVGTLANGSVAGATSPLYKLDWSNDTNNRFTNRLNVAMLMPDKTMYPGSTYRVQIAGTNNGNPFTKDFTFTTGGLAAYDACIAPSYSGHLTTTVGNIDVQGYFCAGIGIEGPQNTIIVPTVTTKF